MKENIDKFIGHFQERLREIGEINTGGYDHQYQKTLLVSALDALARCIYPRHNNRKRITEFVKGFSDWPDSQRVSLPHLSRLLARVPDPEFSPLRGFVREQIAAWKPGKIIYVKNDPEFNQIRTLWPKSSELRTPLEDLTIESCTHLQLFYTYRNSLIHEFRTPGHSMEWSDHNEPFYVHQDTLTPGGELKASGWLLTYPLPFVNDIVLKCLDGLKKYLKAEQIDPYESYNFGDYWLDPLNR